MLRKKILVKEILCGFVTAIVVGGLLVWEALSKQGDMPTFIITALAFIAAAYAIYQQHNAGVKQEIIGAWQVLSNKAAGNSGKKEAIEFLVKQRKNLQGINMSETHHKGAVYLNELDVSEKTLGCKAELPRANFEGAKLFRAHFEGAELWGANFEGAYLGHSHFEGANLIKANFQDSYIASYCVGKKYDNHLPKTASNDQFKFECDDRKHEPELDKKGKPTGIIKHFIKLVKNPNYKPKPNEMD